MLGYLNVAGTGFGTHQAFSGCTTSAINLKGLIGPTGVNKPNIKINSKLVVGLVHRASIWFYSGIRYLSDIDGNRTSGQADELATRRTNLTSKI